MKNRSILFLLLSFFLIEMTFTQTYKVSLTHDKLQHDSLFLQQYNGKKFITLTALKNEKSVLFKGKTLLTPAMYQITGDSITLAEFLISVPTKNFQLQIEVEGDNIIYKNSAENEDYVNYIRETLHYKKDMADFEKEFKKLQQSQLPDYMKQNMANNIMEKAQKLETEHLEYQEEMIEKHEGTLLASLIKLGKELPPPPQYYYQNQMLLYSYFAEHSFDYYDFNDERLLYTPIASDKIKDYAKLLYQFEDQDGVPFIEALLKKMKISTTTYYLFFDQLERVLGIIYSPFWTEDLYIAMLKDVLAMTDLEEARKVRYTSELEKIDKNRKGALLPDFPIQLSDDSLTSLHQIKSDYLIIYFQNPDCPTCVTVREAMKNMPLLNQAIEKGKINVLTVYFEEEEDLWRNYLDKEANPLYLNGWNYTHNIESDNLYDLRTIPYVFLVDKDKRVIKKDLLVNEIEYYVKNLK